VVITVATDLREVLDVDDVEFQRVPLTAEAAKLPILEDVAIARSDPAPQIVLPPRVVLPIVAAERHWGSYILTARPGLVMSMARRAVAVTLTHQVAIALAAAAASPSR
jgi:hypothetical protein